VKTNRLCKNCNKEFEVEKREVNRGNGIFCSRSCSSTFNAKRISKEFNTVCAYCDKEFYRSQSDKKNSKSGLHFCSRLCKDTAQRIGGIEAIQPKHYNSELTQYRTTLKRGRGITHCERCGYNNHPEILQVHHKDRNRKNNATDNLEVLCPNCHSYDHYINKDGMYNQLKESSNLT